MSSSSLNTSMKPRKIKITRKKKAILIRVNDIVYNRVARVAVENNESFQNVILMCVMESIEKIEEESLKIKKEVGLSW